MRKDFLSGRPQEKVVVYSGDRYWLSALITIRINAPLTAAGYQIIQGNDSQGLMVTDLTGVDFVIVHRDFPRQINQYFHVLREARKHEIPIIYEIDDLLFDLPADHPERRNGYYTQGLVAMLLAARKADLVTTTTEQLANFLCPFNPNIRILPNYLDDSLWHMKPPKQAEPDQGKIVVGYIGGESHFPDLKMIVPALTALIEKYGSEIEFKFWGLQPPEELTANSQVEGFPPVYDYQKFANSFSSERIDLLIAPLLNNIFNNCKSNLKFLEYSALGVPAVYSRSVPYEGIVKHGINGFLASSTEEWYRCMQALIESPTLRDQMAINAQETVKKDWLLSLHAGDWADAYHSITYIKQAVPEVVQEQESVLEKVLQEQMTRVNYLQENLNEQEKSAQVLKSQMEDLQAQEADREQANQTLSVQLAEKEQAVQALSAQAAEREQQMEALAGQLHEITASKAWGAALLLRRMRVFLLPPGSLRLQLARKILTPLLFHKSK